MDVRTEKPTTLVQAAAIHDLYQQLDPTQPDPDLCDALAAAATEPVQPRSVRQLIRRFAALDVRVAAAESPAETVRAVFDSIRAMLRHVPAADADKAATEILAVGRGVYAALLVARVQQWEPATGESREVA
jgi:hypothetical protein